MTSPPPNSGSLTLNQAAMQNAQVREVSCEELESANKEAREKETRDSFPGGAHATAYRKDGAGNGKYMKAMCPNMPKKEYENGYQDTVTDKQQPPCAGGRPTSNGRRNDAENKILHPEMKAGNGGSIRMSIFHTASGGGAADAMPCYSCRQAICEAEKCGITVTLCTSKKPPDEVKAATLCNNGKPHGGTADYDPTWAKAGLG
jgi:hypothetical protein